MSYYDKDYPRHFDNEIDLKTCTSCNGSGEVDSNESECCGAKMDSDTLICLDCKEHSQFSKIPCEDCEGTGYVKPE